MPKIMEYHDDAQLVSLSVEDASDLLAAYDEGSCSLHPDDRDAYLARFDGIRKRLAKLEEEK